MDLAGFVEMGRSESGLVSVATTRADGSVQATVVNAGVLAHPVTGADVVGFVAGGRAKIANLRARPRATVTVRSGWRWATVEGATDLAGPDDALPGVDDLPALLRAIFTAAGGTHDDWDSYDAAMAREGRVAVLVAPERVYGI